MSDYIFSDLKIRKQSNPFENNDSCDSQFLKGDSVLDDSFIFSLNINTKEKSSQKEKEDDNSKNITQKLSTKSDNQKVSFISDIVDKLVPIEKQVDETSQKN